MTYGVKLKVWGELAAFNRPEMKVERVSYDIITPSAARGILEAIYWKPQMRWVVDRIHVLAPIRFTQVRRNELSFTIPVKGAMGAGAAMKSGVGRLGTTIEAERQQRAALLLRDVCYGIEAHVRVLESCDGDATDARPEAKHLDSFRRRAAKGQYFHHPYLGCREFPASFAAVETLPPCPVELQGTTRDLGWMLHDIVFVEDRSGGIVDRRTGARLRAEPRFFRAEMRDGVVAVPALEDADGVRK